ncbi:MAG: type IX secretion system sortase PorU [Lentimicrobiaceae bacterium]|jgi:hypothetical protein|nr:type IX secretion system sortase PorU [Lentimicrobiaceae bacterium]
MRNFLFQKRYLHCFCLILFLAYSQFVVGQTKTIPVIIDWEYVDISAHYSNDSLEKILALNEATFFQSNEQALPWQLLNIQTTENVRIDFISCEPTRADTIDLNVFNEFDFAFAQLTNDFVIKQHTARNIIRTYIQPLKIENGKLIRLVSGLLTYTETPITKKQDEIPYTSSSVLAEGEWYKLGVTQKGIYKIAYQDLIDLGIDVATINPKHISIFGNGGAAMPEANQTYYPDDLAENAIFISGENDNKFDEEDAILFYGEEPIEWVYNSKSQQYEHATNVYTDTVYYFLRVDNTTLGKRIQNIPFIQEEASNTITDFHDYLIHKKEEQSPAPFGRLWVGDMISSDEVSEINLLFQIPGLIKSHKIKTAIETVGYSKKNIYWDAFANGTPIIKHKMMNSTGDHWFSRISADTSAFISDSENININLRIETTVSANFWIHYVQLNFRRALQYSNQTFFFRISPQEFSDKLSQLEINGYHQNMMIWNISDPKNIASVYFELSDNKAIFKERFTRQQEYVAFNNDTFLSIASGRKLENQNLHQLGNADMIIICPKEWIEQGEELADLHQQLDGLNTIVVDVEEIYNEFGNGTCDPSSIRNFVRMIYTRSDKNLKYLLLFGDTSFDFRDKLGYNSNSITAYQSKESLNETYSYVTDDYFALLDLTEGYECSGTVDIGVGRLPVNTKQQAVDMVNKIKHYCLAQQTIGQWRNKMLVMADDEDGNEYVNQSEKLAIQIDTSAKNLVVNKLYIDAFEQIRVSEGYRYPEANKILLKKFDEGLFILNYIGHGGVLGITDEKVLTSADAMNLKNGDKLPFMLSATCEMTRFDDPSIVSLGELLILNKNGGIIATFTTSRPVYPSPANSALRAFYKGLFKKNGAIATLGDAFMNAKSNASYLCFPLIGDPALKLAYPQKKIICTYVKTKENEGIPSSDIQTTVSAMESLFVEGHITDLQGNLDTHFNGYLIPQLFDKKSVYHTLGNDPNSLVQTFQQFDNVLHNGKVSVENGKFKFMFKLPLDIRYDTGYAKLSLYAYDTITFKDATGTYNDLFIGGIAKDVVIDTQGPDITLYWNDPSFVSGQIVDDKGTLFAEFHDPQGIHYSTNAIGRDITLTHNEQSNLSRIINHLFDPKTDDFTRGNLKVDFTSLENGEHQLKLKAWDLHNNLSEKEIRFIVAKTHSDAISHVLNYPNPFRTTTTFSFENDDFETIFDVLIDIFDIYGNHIIQLKGEKHPHVKDILEWDGKDARGNILGSGTYIYRVIVSNEKGMRKIFNQRLVYIR